MKQSILIAIGSFGRNLFPELKLNAAFLTLALFSVTFGSFAQGGRVVAWGLNHEGQTGVPASATNVVAISANGSWSMALNADGSITTWGSNESGQRNVPAGLTNVSTIAAGDGHGMALRTNGTVMTWPDATNIPAGLSNVVAISAGGYCLALKSDTTVVAWGGGNYGQHNIPAGLSNVVSIAAGYLFAMALKADGTVVAWGNGFDDDLPPGVTNVVAIAAGRNHCLALRSDSTVVAWGGQTTVPASLSNVVAIAGGGEHSLALKSDGRLVTWGSTNYGEANIPANLSNVVAISCGTRHSMALTKGSGLKIISEPQSLSSYSGRTVQFTVQAVGTPPLTYQWIFNGTNLVGETNSTLKLYNVQPSDAGDYRAIIRDLSQMLASSVATLTVSHSSPFIVVSPSPQVSYLGGTARFDVLAEGSHPLNYQWRFNGNPLPGKTNSALLLENLTFDDVGQYSVVIGNSFGSTTSTNAFLYVNNIVAWNGSGNILTNVPPGLSNVVAFASLYASVALKETGEIVAWDRNSVRTNVPSNLSNVIAVATGVQHHVALHANGTVTAWGDDDYYGGTNVPPSLTNAVAISSGPYHTLALRADGTVTGWGGSSQTNAPVWLNNNIVSISAGESHNLALRADGIIISWWGAGHTTEIIGVVTNAVAVAAGVDGCSFVLKSDGTVDQRFYGGPLTNFPGVSNIVAISADKSYGTVTALRNDGTLVSWWGSYLFTNYPPVLTNIADIARGESILGLIGKPNPKILGSPSINNNAATLTWRALANRRYRVEYTPNVGATSWTPIIPDILAHGSRVSITNDISGDGQRFYRVRLLP